MRYEYRECLQTSFGQDTNPSSSGEGNILGVTKPSSTLFAYRDSRCRLHRGTVATQESTESLKRYGGPTFAHRVGYAQFGGCMRSWASWRFWVWWFEESIWDLHFQITERGLKRLQWLPANDEPSPLEELLAPLLRGGAIARKG